MESVSIPIQLTLADWHVYQRACLEHLRPNESALRQWLRVLSFTAATVLVLYLAGRAGMPLDGWSIALGAGGTFGVFLINSLLIKKLYAPPADSAIFEPRTYTLETPGLRVGGSTSSSFTAWSAVREVTSTNEHVFLWVDRFQAHIIPTRTLPVGITRDGLIDEIRRLRDGAPPSAPAPSGQAQQATLTSADAAHISRTRLYWGWLATIGHLLALRGQRIPPAATGERWVTAGLVLVTVGVWSAIDWLKNQPDPEFYPYGAPDAAWYALGILAVAFVLERLVSPRIGYARALIVLLTVAPLILASVYVLNWYLEGWWSVFAAVFIVVYFIAYLTRGPAAFSGRSQPKAASVAFLTTIALLWVTEWLWVYPSVWYASEPESESEVAPTQVEPLIFAQPARVERALESVERGDPTAVDVYFVGFAGFGEQRVFAEEIKLAARVVGERYAARERALLLLNDVRDQEGAPLATISTLRYALNGVAARMDIEQDVLFLALSSHGSDEWAISVTNGFLPLTDLSSTELATLLDESGIKWRIIVVSACYAGGFIDALRNPYTIILAAASADRTSFGCSDDRDLTYFGEAFYRDALPEAPSLRAAFATAQELIAEREASEGIAKASLPVADFGAELERKLDTAEPE